MTPTPDGATLLTGSWKTTFEQAAAAYDGPILIWLLAIPGALLVLPLLSVACGRWMRGVSRAFGLLTGGACCLAVIALMFSGPTPWDGRKFNSGSICRGRSSRC